MPDLILEMPAVPEGFCNSLNDANWVQTLINLVAQGVAKMEGSGFSVVMKQATAPSANDRDNLWYDTDVGRMYHWDVASGAWIAPHPEEAGGDARRWWTGTLTDLITYDGGSAGAVAASSGPMWEEDTDFQGRSPMGPGVIPSSSPGGAAPDVSIALGAAYGVGAYALGAGEGTEHYHGTGADAGADAVWMKYGSGEACASFAGTYFDQFYNTLVRTNNTGNVSAFTITTEVLGETAAGDGHQTVHPVRGIYCIKRTARLNYVGA